MKANPDIRTIWGIAKSPELLLNDEELHLVVQANTGKTSIKELNKREIGIVVGVLKHMKDSSKNGVREQKRRKGNTSTENQRKKIYKLVQELGWNNQARVNGLCKKMFGVAAIEWLSYQQCSKLIEALKSMLQRQNEKVV